jgi:hypothetical protein
MSDHDLVGASDPFIFDWAREARFEAMVAQGHPD